MSIGIIPRLFFWINFKYGLVKFYLNQMFWFFYHYRNFISFKQLFTCFSCFSSYLFLVIATLLLRFFSSVSPNNRLFIIHTTLKVFWLLSPFVVEEVTRFGSFWICLGQIIIVGRSKGLSGMLISNSLVSKVFLLRVLMALRIHLNSYLWDYAFWLTFFFRNCWDFLESSQINILTIHWTYIS